MAEDAQHAESDHGAVDRPAGGGGGIGPEAHAGRVEQGRVEADIDLEAGHAETVVQRDRHRHPLARLAERRADADLACQRGAHRQTRYVDERGVEAVAGEDADQTAPRALLHRRRVEIELVGRQVDADRHEALTLVGAVSGLEHQLGRTGVGIDHVPHDLRRSLERGATLRRAHADRGRRGRTDEPAEHGGAGSVGDLERVRRPRQGDHDLEGSGPFNFVDAVVGHGRVERHRDDILVGVHDLDLERENPRQEGVRGRRRRRRPRGPRVAEDRFELDEPRPLAVEDPLDHQDL